jgi:hypothetical protein
MAWPRRFLAVPTSALWVDPAISPQSSKGYSDRELQEIAATVPSIYDLMDDGWTEQDFLDARLASDPKQRRLGETYAQLFSDSPSRSPLAASYNGADLVVDKGNHRIRAARSVGVPVVPVWVSAPSEQDLDRIDAACARRIEQEGAAQHRAGHMKHETSKDRTMTLTGERAPCFEGERRRHNPEGH